MTDRKDEARVLLVNHHTRGINRPTDSPGFICPSVTRDRNLFVVCAILTNNNDKFHFHVYPLA